MNTRLRPAFTLVELLIMVAIIVTLAGIGIGAINPEKNQIDATDALRLKSIATIKEAIDTYEIANFVKPYSTNVLPGIYYDICADGQTGDCIDMSLLVSTGYLADFPEDPATKSGSSMKNINGTESLVAISGYCLFKNTNGIIDITAPFLGTSPSQKATTTCDDLNVANGYGGSGGSGGGGGVTVYDPSSCVISDFGGPILHLIGNDLNGLSDGASITTWTAATGTSNDGTAAGSNRPTLLKNALNGYSVVDFDGVNDYMNIPNLGIGTEYSVFAVVVADDSSEGRFIGYNGSDEARFYIGVNNNDPFSASNYTLQILQDDTTGNNYDGSDVEVNEWMTVTMASKYNETIELYRNNVEIGAFATNTKARASTSSPVIGAEQGGSGRWFDGKIAELIIYNTKLNSTNRTSVNNCLSAKYNLAEASCIESTVAIDVVAGDYNSRTLVPPVTCPDGMVATSLAYEGNTEAITLACSWLNGNGTLGIEADYIDHSYINLAGSLTEHSCPSGEVITNIRYKDSAGGNSDYMSGVAIQCAPWTSNGLDYTSETIYSSAYLDSVGRTLTCNYGCPVGMIVTGVTYDEFSYMGSTDSIYNITCGVVHTSCNGVSEQVEVCDDGIDNDSNGDTDQDDAVCYPTAYDTACSDAEICDNGLDDDGDGDTDCDDSQCSPYASCP